MKKAILYAILGIFFAVLTTPDALARGGSGGRGGGHARLGGHSSKIGPGTGSSSSSHSVRGHFHKDGAYIPPHHRTNPDRNFNNNWSTKPNANPYTGKEGTKTEPSRN